MKIHPILGLPNSFTYFAFHKPHPPSLSNCSGATYQYPASSYVPACGTTDDRQWTAYANLLRQGYGGQEASADKPTYTMASSGQCTDRKAPCPQYQKHKIIQLLDNW